MYVVGVVMCFFMFFLCMSFENLKKYFILIASRDKIRGGLLFLGISNLLLYVK